MFTLPRSVIRQVRCVFQRAVGRASRRQAGPLVVLEASADGLVIRATGPDAAIEYRHPGAFDPAQFALPLGVLAECEGRKDSPVHFELHNPTRLRLSWHDGVVPRIKDIDTAELPDQAFPMLPENLQSAEPGLIAALHAAAETTDQESSRYALACIQLRGQAGQVVATDGRQLLVQGGYVFPWTDDLLVPGLSVFGSRELPRDLPIQIGRSAKHVTLVVGPWTIHLAINQDGRFPKVDDVVPAAAAALARLDLHPADSAFLLDTIGRLPSDETLNYPITLDLNGRVVVRARSEGEPRPTEVVLSNSSLSGEPIRLSTNRHYLARAAKLGFREVCSYGKDNAVLAHDQRRQYVWMLLAADGVIPPADDAVRIESPPAKKHYSIRHNRIKEMNVTQSIPTVADVPAATTKPSKRLVSATIKTPVEQAIALRDALQLAARQANELARTIKRQKRQNRIVESTLASLKLLQKVAS